MRGWIVRPIRSPAGRRATCASPRAMTRPTSPRRCWRWCTRPATRCTSAVCPQAWERQPVGEAAGMAAHESQSLIVEMQAGRSDAFLNWLGPELHATFGGDAAPYRPDNLARLWRRVQRGFIRVDADEMTYPAHVILRFRLEQALVAGIAGGGGPAGRVERRVPLAARDGAAGRCARLPAGHPLVRRRVRLFSVATRWARWRRRN